MRLPAIFIFISAILSACGPHDQFPNRQSAVIGNSSSEHVSKGTVLKFLKSEGLIKSDTTIDSISWKSDISKWLVIVSYPHKDHFFVSAHWFVDSSAKDYSGGICTQ